MALRRIDICLATEFFYPTFSGAGERFRHYAPGLRARGIEMRVFTSTHERNQNTDGHLGKARRKGRMLPIEELNGLAVQRVQFPQSESSSERLRYVRTLLRYCRQPDTRPDLIHLLSASQDWLPYFISFRRLGLPIVQSHTLMGSLSSKHWKRFLQRLFWKRLPFQLGDCVVTASSVGRDYLRRIGVKQRIEVIPNGLDLLRFQPIGSSENKLALRSRLGLSPSAELILFVGALIERKGVDVLIKAWRLIIEERPRSYLLLVGPNENDMRQDMRSPGFQSRIGIDIVNSGAPDRIISTGRVENVEDYYRAADVFVFPSRREGMPNAVLEAFGCGVATVMVPFVGISTEYGQPGEHYILVERTPEALAKATIALLKNPTRRHTLAANSRRWAEENLNIDSTLDQYASLYREIVDRSSNGMLSS